MLSHLQNSKTNMKTNPDKIVNRDFPEKKSWYDIFAISPTPTNSVGMFTAIIAS